MKEEINKTNAVSTLIIDVSPKTFMCAFALR